MWRRVTLRAIAEGLNTTTMTIYRKLTKAGINIKDLRDGGNGEITPQGAGIIASLYRNTTTTTDNEAAQQVITEVLTGGATGTTGTETPSRGAERAQVAALEARVEGLQALIAQLESERDELRKQLNQVTSLLQAEQADRQQERLLLTGGALDAQGSTQRRGWFSRLFHRD